MVKSKYDFKSLVLGGCGPKCIGYMGFLHQFETKDCFNLGNIDTFVGVSSGSMLSYFLSIGYTPHELLQKISKYEMFQNLHYTKNYANFFIQANGIYDYNVINEYIQKLTFEKTGKLSITFKDIREVYKKRLVICSYNYTKSKTVYFDSANAKYDDMSCLVAIRCSSNIPILFSAFFYKDCEYIDGGFCDNLPIHKADTKLYNVLVLKTTMVSSKMLPEHPILNKILGVMQVPVNSWINHRIKECSAKVRIANIHMDNYSVYNFDLKNTDILDMFSLGMEYANDILDIWELGHLKKD